MNIITNNNTKCLDALKVLENVIDPEIGLNVADLGLIYQVDFDEAAKKIYLAMTLTTQFCPMGESILDGARSALAVAFPADEVIVELTFNPPWHHGLITEAGQKFLNA